MRYKDIKEAVKLLDNEWNLGKKESGATNDICAWIYMFDILEKTERFVYYREDGILRGFAGYSKVNSKKHVVRKKMYSIIKNRLYKSKSIKNVSALHAYDRNYECIPKNLKEKYDGEISIIILDSSLRGKGIGKKLLINICDVARRDNLKNLYALTDDACSFYIYDSLGYSRVYEKTIKNEEQDILGNDLTEHAYVYGIEL